MFVRKHLSVSENVSLTCKIVFIIKLNYEQHKLIIYYNAFIIIANVGNNHVDAQMSVNERRLD